MSKIIPNKLKISIIGGSGFIGTNLCRCLFKKNILFEIIDIKKSEEFDSLTKIGDVRCLSDMRELISGNVVINLAAEHKDDLRDISQYYATNVEGAYNVAKVCEEKKIRKIIFTSSVAVYGFVKELTCEEGAIKPFNDYGKSKYLAEKEYCKWCELHAKNNLVIIRPTVVFGEKNRGNVYNLLNQIAKKQFVVIGSGENKKSLAYVQNIAEFIMQSIWFSEKNITLNYADTPNLTMNEIVKHACEQLKVELIVKYKIPYRIALFAGKAIDIIARLFGLSLPVSYVRVKKICATTAFKSSSQYMERFSPPYTLTEGLCKTIKYEFGKE